MIALCLAALGPSVVVAALGSAARAEPHVALVVGDAPTADVTIARVSLESSGLEVSVIDAQAAPYQGELLALARAQKDARRAVDDARALFVDTRYAEARALAADAEKRAAPWAGEPTVARALAELALITAQCGDESAYALAALRFAPLQLDEARWSPTVREAFAHAVAELARSRHAKLVVHAPPGAGLYVDGVRVDERELSLPLGAHALYLSAPDEAPAHAAARLDHAGAPPTEVAIMGTPLSDDDRLGALRLRVGSDAKLGSEELRAAAAQLRVDAVVSFAFVEGRAVVHAWAPGLVVEPIVLAGDRGEAIPTAAHEAAARMHAAFAITHAPPERARAGTPLQLKVEAGASVRRVTLSYLTTLGRKWEQRRGEVGGGEAVFELGRTQLPSSDRPYMLEYYLSAEGERGDELTTLRDASTPLRLPIDPDRERPHWYKKWWIWTVVGVVAAGAVTTAVVLTTRPAPMARLYDR